MIKSQYLKENILIFFGIIIKLLVDSLIDRKSFQSLSYSSTDSLESVKEALILKELNYPVYSEESIHQAPFNLYLFMKLIQLPLLVQKIIFLLIDVFCILELLKTVNVIHKILIEKYNFKGNYKEIQLNISDSSQMRLLVIYGYILNPFIIISSITMSVTCIYNLIFIKLIYYTCKKNVIMATLLCSFLAYSQMYSILYIVPIILSHKSKNLFPIGLLVLFLSVFIGLSVYLEGFQYINNVYFHHIKLDDSTPQLNIYWYMMAEMFDHFREFFKYSFQIIIFGVCGGLMIKYYDDFMFLFVSLYFLLTIIKPYPSVGEVGLMLSLVPVYKHLVPYFKWVSVFVCMFVCVLFLAPLMYHLWLINGSANANFYFAITMVFSSAQAQLFSSLLQGYHIFNFKLKHGPVIKLSDGSECQIRPK